MEARVISYPNTLPMCCPTGDGAAAIVLVSESKLQDALARAAAARGEDRRVGAHQRPVGRGRRVAARRQHAHPQRGRQGVRARRASARKTSTWWSCTTASPPPSSSTTTTCGSASPVARASSSTRRRPWRDGTTPVNVSGGLLSKGHPIGMTGAAGVFEITTQLRGEAGDRQIEGAKVGMAHVIGLGSSCGIHILEKAAL